MAVRAVIRGSFYVWRSESCTVPPQMASEPDLPPAGEEWRRRPGVWRQGLRFGSIGCIGCGTFVVLLIAAVILLAALGESHSGGSGSPTTTETTTETAPPPVVSPAEEQEGRAQFEAETRRGDKERRAAESEARQHEKEALEGKG